MMNYIKSEFYRVFHTKGFYLFTGSGVALVLAMNIVLWACGKNTPSFHYNTTAFSFSMLYHGGFQALLYLTLALSGIIFGNEFKNKTINNSVAFGCSREMLFMGKLVVTLVCSFVCLVVTEGALIGSGYLLLKSNGMEDAVQILRVTASCTPILICGACGAVSLFYILGSETKAIWVWLLLMVGVTGVVSLLGMKFEVFARLSHWLIITLVTENSTNPETGVITMVWDTAEGLHRCIMAGVLGTIVFLAAGLVGVHRKELK